MSVAKADRLRLIREAHRRALGLDTRRDASAYAGSPDLDATATGEIGGESNDDVADRIVRGAVRSIDARYL